MKTLLIILMAVFTPKLVAEQPVYDLLHHLVQGSEQQNEQKKQEQQSCVSYSEATYHMAEGAVVTAAVCLPTIYCFKFLGFEAMCKDEVIFADYAFLPICAALLQASPGFSWQIKYVLKAYNSRQPLTVKKKYNPQVHDFTIEPVSYQDKLNAHAKLIGSALALVGIGVAVYRSLND